MIAPNPSEPHDPTRECEQFHCALHNVDEYGSYYTCGECLHNFASEVELLADVAARMLGDGLPTHDGTTSLLPTSGEDVVVCPHCGHDF